VNNTGTLEATTGGTLTLSGAAVNGGTILSSGGGSVVNVDNGSVITGSTLTTSGGGVMQHTAGAATFDGVTLSAGSTLTLGDGATTTLAGAITNNGNLFQNSTGSNTDVHISGAVTLNGNGTWDLSNNFNNRVYGNGSDALVNGVGHTIEGSGQFGIGGGGNGFTLTNNGTILANQSTELQLAPGSVTNNGTVQVNAGSTMHVEAGFTNFAAGTLTGGTYVVAGTAGSPGTLQIDALGNTGGEIVSNDATIVLNGPTAAITDSLNRNALSAFQDNLAGGSFTVEGGQLFSTAPAGDFTNAGAVDVGAGSSFTTSTNYTQTGGTTQDDGTLTANGGQINIDGGTLSGLGTAIATAVNINAGGTLSPGDPGDFNVIGNLTLQGTYNEQIAGAAAGSFDEVLVNGTANVTGGNLDVSLLGGYTPTAGTHFVILDSTGALSGAFATADGVAIAGDAFTADGQNFTIDYTPNEVILDDVGANGGGGNGGGGGTSPTPEPAFFVPLVAGIGAMIGVKARKRRQGLAIESL
jgi:filamentous hemagglutinin